MSISVENAHLREQDARRTSADGTEAGENERGNGGAVPAEWLDWGAVPGLKAVANPSRCKPRRRADGAWQPQTVPLPQWGVKDEPCCFRAGS